jgi:TRAP-type C4-dicarboxylate transport system substrate-binding protein
MQAVGATPLALPFSEVYTSLQTGVIDSVMTSSPTAVDAKFREVLKYFEPMNITIATNMVTVNQKAFDKLPKSQQVVLVNAGREMEQGLWAGVRKWDGDMVATSKKMASRPSPPPGGSSQISKRSQKTFAPSGSKGLPRTPGKSMTSS